jgi:propanediol dehydratase small subunit
MTLRIYAEFNMGLQYTALLGAISVSVLAVAFMLLMFPRTIRVYWERSCTGQAWKRSFPHASKQEIRKFLHLFVDAFAFQKSRALYFAPADRVLAIYRALYPVKGWPDALELACTIHERSEVAVGRCH